MSSERESCTVTFSVAAGSDRSAFLRAIEVLGHRWQSELTGFRDVWVELPRSVDKASEPWASKPLKALDDPRLQELFSSAILGALAFGAQDTNPPPAGHWLTEFWQLARAERAGLAETQPSNATETAKSTKPSSEVGS